MFRFKRHEFYLPSLYLVVSLLCASGDRFKASMVAVLHQFSPQWFYFIWESGQHIWCQLASWYVRRSFCFILGFMPTHTPPERHIRPQEYNLSLYLDDGPRATFWNIKNWELLVYVCRKGWQEGQKLQMNQFYRFDSICEVVVGSYHTNCTFTITEQDVGYKNRSDLFPHTSNMLTCKSCQQHPV